MPSAIIPDAERTADAILSVIERYRLKARPYNPGVVFEARGVFHPYLVECVQKQSKIRLVLPAFPFKSPNDVDKVLGTLPDKAEDVSLALLQGLCNGIHDVYEPGATLVIVSDGIVYNDLLGVPDQTVWRYGEALRAMARGHCPSIEFVRISQLLSNNSLPIELTSDINEEKYLDLAPLARVELIAACGDDKFDINHQIASDDNVKATYQGYIKFLMRDLVWQSPDGTSSDSASSPSSDSIKLPFSESTLSSPSDSTTSLSSASTDISSVTNLSTGSRKSHKKKAQRIAKEMITRGNCFAKLIRDSFPNAIRLSIHASSSPSKISISVLPNCFDIPMTPWHCMVMVAVDGTITPLTRREIGLQFENVEPIFRDGRLWAYQERSPLYDWEGLDVEFEHLYPCGLLIKPKQAKTCIEIVDMSKVRRLAEKNSPVILRGFEGARNSETFMFKAKEMGEIQSWKFGDILKVTDGGEENGGLNNVLSREPMPFHYDGLFKIIDGISIPPRFQMFVAITSTPPKSGHTLFAPSNLVFQQLREHYDLDKLRKMTWNVRTKSFDAAKLSGLPLVIDHPATGGPALRYHEDWPQEKTRFDESLVRFENMDDDEDCALREVIDEILYDRRVCIRVSWEKGDVIISDNISMMHTREGFDAKEKRSYGAYMLIDSEVRDDWCNK